MMIVVMVLVRLMPVAFMMLMASAIIAVSVVDVVTFMPLSSMIDAA